MHIVLVGRTNTGKSSLINCLLDQERAIVSNVAGTTTAPQYNFFLMLIFIRYFLHLHFKCLSNFLKYILMFV